MLILVAVTVTIAMDGGIFTKAKQGATETQLKADEEDLTAAIASAYDGVTGTIDYTELKTTLEGKGWTVGEKDSATDPWTCTCTSKKGNTFTVTGKGKIKVAEENKEGTSEKTVEDDLSLTTSYVGYYADTDGDLTNGPEGVIFVDLMKGANGDQATVNGKWNDVLDSTYSYTTITESKAYSVTTENYTGINAKFGEKPIISVKTGSIGNDRFYVMALENVDSNYHYWYKNAYENMSDYATATSEDFGKGRENTYAMINKWNNSSYGAQTTTGNNADMWGIIQNQTKYPVTTNGTTGWFVPSRAEWSAFAYAFNIEGGYDEVVGSHMQDIYEYDEDLGEDVWVGEEEVEDTEWINGNSADLGLSCDYWSSSQSGTGLVYNADFENGVVHYYGVVGGFDYVRLATTF